MAFEFGHQYTAEELLESFYMTLMTFTDNLEALSSDPETTCRELGDYNTAWELKHELSRDGEGLLTVWRKHLSAEQIAAVADLVAALESVPAHSIPAGAGRTANLKAMSREEWVPLRKSSGPVFVLLSGLRAQAAQYFGRSV